MHYLLASRVLIHLCYEKLCQNSVIGFASLLFIMGIPKLSHENISVASFYFYFNVNKFSSVVKFDKNYLLGEHCK